MYIQKMYNIFDVKKTMLIRECFLDGNICECCFEIFVGVLFLFPDPRVRSCKSQSSIVAPSQNFNLGSGAIIP